MHKGTFFLLLLALCTAVLSTQTECAASDTSLVPICEIQGDGFSSPRAGEAVHAQGVVTADFDHTSLKGFFIQTENCDSNPATSDGVFVYVGERVSLVQTGDLVEVSGTVAEVYGQTRLEVSPANVQILAQGQGLPPAVELQPPFENEAARTYFESLEGMYVSMDSGQVAGPTDARGDTWLVRSDLGIPRVFADDPAGTGEIATIGSEGLFAVPPLKVGDTLQGIAGILDYRAGMYKVLLLTEPVPVPSRFSPAGTESVPSPAFTFGTLNLDNLFDVVDDPDRDDPVRTSAEYQRKLDKLALLIHDGLGEPDFLAVQEAENEIVLLHLAARRGLTVTYEVAWADGPDRRGIDVGLLYNPARVTVNGFAARQGCTLLVDGLGPDGNRDVENPHNEQTCDTNGDGVPDGNRLFSRPPLVVTMTVNLDSGETLPLWVVVNHWKSKREDTREQAYTRPRRLAQAEFVGALASEIEAEHPGAAVIVLGDLNDTPASQPLAVLAAAGLWNASRTIVRAERYTYVYRGVSQALDHVLVSPGMAVNWIKIQPVHLGADYPAVYENRGDVVYRASDHDPLLVQYFVLPWRVYLPLAGR